MAIKPISRRSLFRILGAGGAAAALGPTRAEAAPEGAGDEFHSLLIDTTRCVGCRSCEAACAAAHDLAAPAFGLRQAETRRDTSDHQLTVVNRFVTSAGYVFAKKQCMHCNQPACASACLTGALKKTAGGAVTWNGDKCMGCRLCMVSCPFDVPRFEYDSYNPKIVKCDLCYERTQQGKTTACTEACPAKAIRFGTRREMLKLARHRIESNPGKYVDHIYGEREAGGTGVLYLSAVDVGQLGMNRQVSNEPYPQLTKPFLSAVPLAFTILPVLMLGIAQATRKNGGH